MSDPNHLLRLAVEHASAAVSVLGAADEVRWVGLAAGRYRLLLEDLRVQAAAVVASLAAERAALEPWEEPP